MLSVLVGESRDGATAATCTLSCGLHGRGSSAESSLSALSEEGDGECERDHGGWA